IIAFATFPSLFVTSATLEASRALPRTVATGENVQLAMPRDLEYTALRGAVGLDFEDAKLRNQALATARQYVSIRRKPSTRAGFDKKCETFAATPNHIPDLNSAFCTIENERRSRPTAEARRALPRSERLEIANLLTNEQWDSVASIPYPRVVGIVGTIQDKDTLMQIGSVLSRKRRCTSPKAASAIAYKLEEHFPAPDAIEIARALYDSASNCAGRAPSSTAESIDPDADFPTAKAAYRLALLDIWQNRCERVPKLMTHVESIPAASQFRSRAKYWRAYCSEILGKRDSSREARESLLFESPMSFHNLAANRDQNNAIAWLTRDTQVPIAFRSLIRPDQNEFLRAIESLVKLGAIDLAADIVDRSTATIQQFEPEVRLYVAALMHKHGQALPKFKILSSLFNDSPRIVSGPTMKLFFPLWFFDIIQSHAGTELDPLLVTALIRQESAFNVQARSRVGARGLMQLMPATARMLAPVRTNRLFDPSTNISLGTKYLRKRLAQYNGDVELTLAAYNAGFSRVDEWRRRYPTENRILFLDLIPFRETRNYVSSILRNYYWYTKLYGAETLLSSHKEMQPDRTSARGAKQTQAQKRATATAPVDVSSVDLSSVFQAITRAESGSALSSLATAITPKAASPDEEVHEEPN
ncbi:MAG: lytic transglycosylase domain-containing protein, partial [Bdellovibrionales bacterium]|nr:lytic transglycosylase domain-containing protein [Bdellovibrionales bacterium]